MKLSKYAMALVIALTTLQVSFSQIRQELLYSIHDSKVTIFSVYDGNNFIGNSLWINRTINSEIKAQYFADKMNYSSIYERFNAWKSGKVLISICSGAFTNDNTKPKGITIDNGTIINRDVDGTMNGLVIVYPTGGIVVSDLSEKNLKLSNNYSTHYLNIRDEYDKNTFFTFAKNESATVFQTQLLIYNNDLKCKPKNEYRERRFLIIAKNRDNNILHIVFDIPKNVQLYSTAQAILNYFKSSGKDIYAMINLDTGSYNMINVYYPNGSKVSDFKGSNDIAGAVNIIAYYYNK